MGVREILFGGAGGASRTADAGLLLLRAFASPPLSPDRLGREAG